MHRPPNHPIPPGHLAHRRRKRLRPKIIFAAYPIPLTTESLAQLEHCFAVVHVQRPRPLRTYNGSGLSHHKGNPLQAIVDVSYHPPCNQERSRIAQAIG
jgi:hypothetical protein